jgi:hypothetical protein
MDRQFKQVGMVMALLFGAIAALGIWASNRHYNAPRMGDVVGCWASGPWRVQISEDALRTASRRFRTTGLQQIKDHWFIEAEPFEVAGSDLRPTKAKSQPGWVDIEASGRMVRRVRVEGANFQSTPWLVRC